jgi:hypothetical protein
VSLPKKIGNLAEFAMNDVPTDAAFVAPVIIDAPAEVVSAAERATDDGSVSVKLNKENLGLR